MVERDPATGRERDVEVPRIDLICRDQERAEGITLVGDVVEQLRHVAVQYGEVLPDYVVADSLRVIERLEKHDRSRAGHLFMLDRRLTVLAKRLQEAEQEGTCEVRPDIPWVRQELAMLRWMKARL